MPKKESKESAPTVYAVCKVCGSLFPMEAGKDVPDCCGRQACMDTLNKSRVVATPIYGTNVNVITYVDGFGATVEERPIVESDPNNVKLTKDVDTTKKDRANAKKIDKDFDKRFGKKAKKSTAKKAKSGRVSKSSK